MASACTNTRDCVILVILCTPHHTQNTKQHLCLLLINFSIIIYGWKLYCGKQEEESFFFNV